MSVDSCNNRLGMKSLEKDGEEELQLKELEPVRIKINGKWLLLSAEFVASHPGGSVIYQYRLVF